MEETLEPRVNRVRIFGFLVNWVFTLLLYEAPFSFSRDARNKGLFKSNTMVLTEEQKERIRKNRERALEIQKRRREESGAKQVSPEKGSSDGSRCEISPAEKKIRVNQGEDAAAGSGQTLDEKDGGHGESVELEEFEDGASKYVTKK